MKIMARSTNIKRSHYFYFRFLFRAFTRALEKVFLILNMFQSYKRLPTDRRSTDSQEDSVGLAWIAGVAIGIFSFIMDGTIYPNMMLKPGISIKFTHSISFFF